MAGLDPSVAALLMQAIQSRQGVVAGKQSALANAIGGFGQSIGRGVERGQQSAFEAQEAQKQRDLALEQQARQNDAAWNRDREQERQSRIDLAEERTRQASGNEALYRGILGPQAQIPQGLGNANPALVSALGQNLYGRQVAGQQDTAAQSLFAPVPFRKPVSYQPQTFGPPPGSMSPVPQQRIPLGTVPAQRPAGIPDAIGRLGSTPNVDPGLRERLITESRPFGRQPAAPKQPAWDASPEGYEQKKQIDAKYEKPKTPAAPKDVAGFAKAMGVPYFDGMSFADVDRSVPSPDNGRFDDATRARMTYVRGEMGRIGQQLAKGDEIVRALGGDPDALRTELADYRKEYGSAAPPLGGSKPFLPGGAGAPAPAGGTPAPAAADPVLKFGFDRLPLAEQQKALNGDPATGLKPMTPEERAKVGR